MPWAKINNKVTINNLIEQNCTFVFRKPSDCVWKMFRCNKIEIQQSDFVNYR